MIETLVALFAAHVAADYILQNSDMAANKDKPGPLFLHGTVVWATSFTATGSIEWPIVLLAVLHTVTDWIKANSAKTVSAHLLDQAAHLTTLTAIAYLFPHLWANGHWAEAPNWVLHAALLVSGAVYATRAGGFAVSELMRNYDLRPSPAGLQNAGQTIGTLERALIYLLMLSDMATGIGFLIAAKSVLRFETGKDTSPDEFRKHSEYVIIGTLASYSWAIAASLLIILLRSQLPDLGIALSAI